MRSDGRIAGFSLGAALAATSCLMNFEQYRPGDAAAPDVRYHDASDVAPHDVPMVDDAADVPVTDVVDVPVVDAMDVTPRDASDVVVADHVDVAMDVRVDVPVAPDVQPDVPPAMDVQPDVPVVPDSGSGNGCAAPYVPTTPGTAPCGTLKINELQTQGAMGASDEFVEVFNAGSCPQSMDQWTIRYSPSSGATPSVHWTGTTATVIPSGGFMLVGGAMFACTNVAGTFAGASGVFSAGGGGVGLYDRSGTRVDSVGYGATTANPLTEGTVAPAPGVAQSIARSSTGGDTDNNAADFTVDTTPTPGAPNR